MNRPKKVKKRTTKKNKNTFKSVVFSVLIGLIGVGMFIAIFYVLVTPSAGVYNHGEILNFHNANDIVMLGTTEKSAISGVEIKNAYVLSDSVWNTKMTNPIVSSNVSADIIGSDNIIASEINNFSGFDVVDYDNASGEITKTTEITKGIEIMDRATGKNICIWIENGQWQKKEGDCANVFASLSDATDVEEKPAISVQELTQVTEPEKQNPVVAETIKQAAPPVNEENKSVDCQPQVATEQVLTEKNNDDKPSSSINLHIGEVIKSAVATLVKESFDLIKYIVMSPFNGAKEVAIVGNGSLAASVINSVNSSSKETKNDIVTLGNEAVSEIKDFVTCAISPIYDLCNFVSSKISNK